MIINKNFHLWNLQNIATTLMGYIRNMNLEKKKRTRKIQRKLSATSQWQPKRKTKWKTSLPLFSLCFYSLLARFSQPNRPKKGLIFLPSICQAKLPFLLFFFPSQKKMSRPPLFLCFSFFLYISKLLHASPSFCLLSALLPLFTPHL